MSTIPPFQPCYVLPGELQLFDLPTVAALPSIASLIQMASSIIDEACGRIDGDGIGSLVYTTYSSRILLQARNRNLIQLPMKPVAAIDTNTVQNLIAAATVNSINCFYTGVIANTLSRYTGDLSGVLAASGRYGYTRQDMAMGYPDLWAQINPLNLITMFGGPAPFVGVDITNLDYDAKTGEAWIPAGLQLQKYSEIVIQYNSGWNPFKIPLPVKLAAASLVKNLMAKGNATTGMTSISLGKSGTNISMMAAVLDPTIDQLLTPFKNIRSY